MPMSSERIASFLREAMQYLAPHESRDREDVIKHLETTFKPSGEELQTDGKGRVLWKTRFHWSSVMLPKAGWMTKDGWGNWSATDAGRKALADYRDPNAFVAAAREGYRKWKKSIEAPQRRAWLVRGSNVRGTNIVSQWLEQEMISLPASQLRPIQQGIDADALRAMAAEDYQHLRHHELEGKVKEIVDFATRMSAGDVVLTTSESSVYVGDVTGNWVYTESDGGLSNLRRPVDWRNEDAPIDFAELPAPLPARLSTGHDVLDLTADIDVIDALTELAVGDAVPGAAPEPLLVRHEHLAIPSPQLADELFADLTWLEEVRDLLDERKQVIFYGPPGTGKTFIARKLAADLVGPEQVKLVQFHPAYTYEDFFEGYRPAPGAGEGTIAFELRAGPLRQLVRRAREHPDQAFVLIIDEINRANLAKVFGELYFLLEYRDEAVDLLYSADDEGFTLPMNLYLIGTMNTADRSIALVDSAMRRRFAFIALDPDTEPTRSLLSRWSERKGLGSTAAALLAELNRRIDDPDFRIGPSYFMKSEAPDAHSADRLDRIWRTSILPLLQEHHYGEWDSVKRRYQLSSLLAVVIGVPETAPEPEEAGNAPGEGAPAGSGGADSGSSGPDE